MNRLTARFRSRRNGPDNEGPLSDSTDETESTATDETAEQPNDENAEADGIVLPDNVADEGAPQETDAQRVTAARRLDPKRVIAIAVLPILTLGLAVGAAYLKWRAGESAADQTAARESVAAASDSTVAMLSYHAETVEHELDAARSRLTGDFLDSFTSLTHDVVIPGAKQKNISIAAKVSAAGSVSATPSHAVVIVFVNQTTTMASEPPTDTASCVRVTLDNKNGRWLVSGFEPI